MGLMRIQAGRLARRLLLIQLLMCAFVAVVAGFWGVAGSALLGGMIVVCSNALFAIMLFLPYRAQQPGRLLSGIYLAELVKLIFVALSFALVFMWLEEINVVALFAAFFMVQVVSILLAQDKDNRA